MRAFLGHNLGQSNKHEPRVYCMPKMRSSCARRQTSHYMVVFCSQVKLSSSTRSTQGEPSYLKSRACFPSTRCHLCTEVGWNDRRPTSVPSSQRLRLHCSPTAAARLRSGNPTSADPLLAHWPAPQPILQGPTTPLLKRCSRQGLHRKGVNTTVRYSTIIELSWIDEAHFISGNAVHKSDFEEMLLLGLHVRLGV